MKAGIYATGIIISLAVFLACGADESMRKPTVNLDKDKAKSEAPHSIRGATCFAGVALATQVESLLASAEPLAKPGRNPPEPRTPFMAAYSAVAKPLAAKAGLAKEGKKAPDNAIKMNVEKILLSSDFEQDPLGAGWRYDAPKIKGVASTGQWTDVAAASGKRCLSAANGGWTSPAIPVKEFEYYALRFMSKADGKSYWAANFFAADGRQINGDHYSSFDPSQNWKENMFCFRARPNTATARVSFEPIANKMIFVDDITVQAISRAEAAKWADAVYATIAPVSFVPPADRWRNLPKTMEALRSGKTLKVVMLGDSIINDTANSAFDVRVERLYPGARLNIVNSVRGATGCWYWKEENRVKEYVLDHRPDFLIIGGISNEKTNTAEAVEAVRSVIRQVRVNKRLEIFVMTGAVGRIDPRKIPDWKPAVTPEGKDYRSLLMKMAHEEKAEFLDMAGAWGSYLKASDKPWEFFTRDNLHANERGRQIISKILEIFFAP